MERKHADDGSVPGFSRLFIKIAIGLVILTHSDGLSAQSPSAQAPSSNPSACPVPFPDAGAADSTLVAESMSGIYDGVYPMLVETVNGVQKESMFKSVTIRFLARGDSLFATWERPGQPVEGLRGTAMKGRACVVGEPGTVNMMGDNVETATRYVFALKGDTLRAIWTTSTPSGAMAPQVRHVNAIRRRSDG